MFAYVAAALVTGNSVCQYSSSSGDRQFCSLIWQQLWWQAVLFINMVAALMTGSSVHLYRSSSGNWQFCLFIWRLLWRQAFLFINTLTALATGHSVHLYSGSSGNRPFCSSIWRQFWRKATSNLLWPCQHCCPIWKQWLLAKKNTISCRLVSASQALPCLLTRSTA